jgi:hypothetical protein
VGEEYRDFTELDVDSDTPEIGVVGVLLRNEGPGVALEVSYRMRSWAQAITTFWTPSVGSLPPGAERTSSTPFDVPSGLTDVELGKADPPPGSSADSIEPARDFCRGFFHWYNQEHRHSGIGLMTPTAVHHGQAQQIHAARATVLEAAYARNPERFVCKSPIPPELPTAAWINKPETKEVAH